MLEHHADLAADFVDALEIVGQLDAVDDDRPCWCSSSRLMQRIMVDLPEPDGPQITIRSPRVTLQIDVAQHVEVAEPFVHADDFDRRIGLERRRLQRGSTATD